jgi:flagellar motor switch protein FliG
MDGSMAGELLKGLDPETVRDLAVELAYLDATGVSRGTQTIEVAKQFFSSLRADEGFQFNRFLQEMLNSAVGEERAKQVQTQIKDLLRKRDPFIPIRSTDAKTIATILESEHPQAAAVILAELPANKSAEVLGHLAEGVRLSVVGRMARCESVSPEAKKRIAEMVSGRVETVRGGAAGEKTTAPEEALRKVAVILRNLGKDVRNGLLAAIKEKDKAAGDKVNNLMVVWEDIPAVGDRSLQEAMRGIDTKKLALALFKADEVIVKKVRSNISERAAATLDEEASLMKAPKKEEIEQAREDLVQALRVMNEKGELTFVEG